MDKICQEPGYQKRQNHRTQPVDKQSQSGYDQKGDHYADNSIERVGLFLVFHSVRFMYAGVGAYTGLNYELNQLNTAARSDHSGA